MKINLQQCGIKHQMLCSYIPQQNRTAERKHRHIIELSLSMMFESHLPLHHWIEAFYSSVYLGNLLPSNIMQFKSPKEMLFGTKLELSALRFFDSACYPYLRPLSDHKMELRLLQCVFLSYSPNQKCYRCHHPPYGKVYTITLILK